MAVYKLGLRSETGAKRRPDTRLRLPPQGEAALAEGCSELELGIHSKPGSPEMSAESRHCRAVRG